MIGIGAGPATDGQVLVFHDLLGIRDGLGARFVKRYANLQQDMNAGVSAYAEDVRARRYPGPEHTYSIDPGRARRAEGPRWARPALQGLAVALGERELLDRFARQARGPGFVAVADEHVGGEHDVVGDPEQLLDLGSAGASSVVSAAPRPSERSPSRMFWTNG